MTCGGVWEGGREREAKKRLRSRREKERWSKKEGGKEGDKTGQEMNATGAGPRRSNGEEANVQMSLPPCLPAPSFLHD